MTIFLSLDRIVRRWRLNRVRGPGALRPQPDQPGSEPGLSKPLTEEPKLSNLSRRKLFVTYGPNPDSFQSIFSSQITGNEVLISYRKSDINGKTRLIRDH